MKITANGIAIPITNDTIDVVFDCGGGRVDMPQTNVSVVNGDLDAKKSKFSTTGNLHLHPFQGTQGVPEESLKELVGSIIDKLIAATPGGYLKHIGYAATKDAVDANAPAIVSMLKDSPTFGAILHALTVSLGGMK